MPTTYLKDEVALLVKYGLLNSLPASKENGGRESGRDRHQTNMIIFTEEYMGELYERLTPLCTAKLTEILDGLRNQLAPLRTIGFCGANLDEDRLELIREMF